MRQGMDLIKVGNYKMSYRPKLRLYQHIAWPTAVAASVPHLRAHAQNDNDAMAAMAGAIPPNPTLGDRLAEALAAVEQAMLLVEAVLARRTKTPGA